jgi:hypothetical protein
VADRPEEPTAEERLRRAIFGISEEEEAAEREAATKLEESVKKYEVRAGVPADDRWFDWAWLGYDQHAYIHPPLKQLDESSWAQLVGLAADMRWLFLDEGRREPYWRYHPALRLLIVTQATARLYGTVTGKLPSVSQAEDLIDALVPRRVGGFLALPMCDALATVLWAPHDRDLLSATTSRLLDNQSTDRLLQVAVYGAERKWQSERWGHTNTDPQPRIPSRQAFIALLQRERDMGSGGRKEGRGVTGPPSRTGSSQETDWTEVLQRAVAHRRRCEQEAEVHPLEHAWPLLHEISNEIRVPRRGLPDENSWRGLVDELVWIAEAWSPGVERQNHYVLELWETLIDLFRAAPQKSLIETAQSSFTGDDLVSRFVSSAATAALREWESGHRSRPT